MRTMRPLACTHVSSSGGSVSGTQRPPEESCTSFFSLRVARVSLGMLVIFSEDLPRLALAHCLENLGRSAGRAPIAFCAFCRHENLHGVLGSNALLLSVERSVVQ